MPASHTRDVSVAIHGNAPDRAVFDPSAPKARAPKKRDRIIHVHPHASPIHIANRATHTATGKGASFVKPPKVA
jgi:hypothetical protein